MGLGLDLGLGLGLGLELWPRPRGLWPRPRGLWPRPRPRGVVASLTSLGEIRKQIGKRYS